MSPFWTYARGMLRYRGLVAGAILMAIVSAFSLGAGLMGIGPIIGQIVDPAKKRDLPALALEWNAKHPERAPISESVIAELPHDPSADERDLRVMAAEWNADHPNLPQIPPDLIPRLPTGRFTAAVWIVSVLGLLTVIGAAANFLHVYLSLTVVNKTSANIRRQVFHRLVRLPLKDVVASGPADAAARVINDTNALSMGFNALLSKGLAQVTQGFAALLVAVITDWRLTGVAILVGPVLATLIRKLGKRIKRASKAALVSQGGLYTAALEALQGLRVVKVHTTERFEAGRFHRFNKQVMHEQNRVRTARALASPLIDVVGIFVIGGLALIALKAILAEQLNPKDFLLTLASLGMAAAQLKPLSGIINDVQQSAGAAERLEELMRPPPEPGHDLALPRLARHAASIEFRNVVFTYPRQNKPSLDGISLTVANGQTVAFVGPNGSGKTTLLAMVPRLFDPDDTRGAVLIDGRDIREVSVRSLRRQIGVVTQETVLFRGTIGSNIAYGAENATRERIEEAAKRARAHEFILEQPQGYETVVAEQGLSLSGGQRQRIAIARAILRDPTILILDEATSMIDADSEAKIAAALAEFGKGRTCLIVAHRLSTVINADSIVVMDQGKVVDRGTHTELLERCETYRLIAKHQLGQG